MFYICRTFNYKHFEWSLVKIGPLVPEILKFEFPPPLIFGFKMRVRHPYLTVPTDKKLLVQAWLQSFLESMGICPSGKHSEILPPQVVPLSALAHGL